MVTAQPVTDILFLVGKLTVGGCATRPAAQLLGNPRLDAPFVIAREVCEGRARANRSEISLRSVAADLRFTSPGGRDVAESAGECILRSFNYAPAYAESAAPHRAVGRSARGSQPGCLARTARLNRRSSLIPNVKTQ